MTIDALISPALAPHALGLGMPGPFEWVIIGIIGLLLFGKRLPEVGKSVAKGIVEFKQGLKEVQDDFEDTGKTISRLDQQPAKRPLPADAERMTRSIDAAPVDGRVESRPAETAAAETAATEPTHSA